MQAACQIARKPINAKILEIGDLLIQVGFIIA